ncbi:PilW family protein [Desulfonatronum parangueonense]
MSRFILLEAFFPASSEAVSGPGSGFTLIETLVALVIAALSITVFFQLFSASMRLEAQARGIASDQFAAAVFFDAMQRLDIRDYDFPWEGEHEGVRWRIRMRPVDVPDEAMDDGFALRMKQELYAMEVFLDSGFSPPTRLLRYVSFPLDFLSADFKSRMQ